MRAMPACEVLQRQVFQSALEERAQEAMQELLRMPVMLLVALAARAAEAEAASAVAVVEPAAALVSDWNWS